MRVFRLLPGPIVTSDDDRFRAFADQTLAKAIEIDWSLLDFWEFCTWYGGPPWQVLADQKPCDTQVFGVAWTVNSVVQQQDSGAHE